MSHTVNYDEQILTSEISALLFTFHIVFTLAIEMSETCVIYFTLALNLDQLRAYMSMKLHFSERTVIYLNSLSMNYGMKNFILKKLYKA